MNKFDYKELTPFKWCVLQNFPFIEADFDAINDYQLLCKVVEYLNKTIDNMNLTGEQMENVTDDFIELTNYVNNKLTELENDFSNLYDYVNNLDLQEEVNNRINEMVTNGEFENIVSNYINKIYYDFVNVKSFGATGDGVTDDTQAIQNAINYIIENFNANNYFTNCLYFPVGKYLISSTITMPNFIVLKSNGNIMLKSKVSGKTFIIDNININSDLSNYHYFGERIQGNFVLELDESVDKNGTIAISIENTNNSVENFNAWNITKNMNIRKFDIGINCIMKNFFIKNFENFVFSKCNTSILFNSNQGNAGEKITLNNVIFGDGELAIENNCNGLELLLENSSIDFCNKGILNKTSGSIFKLTDCHIEGIGYNSDNTETNENNPYLFYNQGSYYSDTMLLLTNVDLMTMRNTPIQSGTNGTKVFVNGVTTKGSQNFKKLFALCDDNCDIVNTKFYPSIYLMMVIQNKINEKIESNFANINNQNLTDNQEINGYTFSTNITGKASITDERYYTSGKSIKYNIPTGGAYFTIKSEEYNVKCGDILANSLYYYYQGSANLGILLSIKTTFYDKDNNIIPYPTTAIDSGVNYQNSTPNEWNRPYQFEQVIVPAKAVKAKTTYTINPPNEGLLYITDFYRSIT